jgi:hypothetical protein
MSVFESRVLIRTWALEATGQRRKQHNAERHNLYSAPNITRMIKSRGMRWTEHVEGMGKMK